MRTDNRKISQRTASGSGRKDDRDEQRREERRV
jgi:hypothetical protein